MGLTFNSEAHEYRLDGHVIPHVTQVTDTLCSYAGVPWDVLERKREIGETVHYATELDDAGDLDDASLPAEIRGYVDAWRKFKRETGFVVVYSEHKVFSKTYHYAGTLDRIGRFASLKNVRRDVSCLIDIKTTHDIMPAVGAQLAAYKRAWEDMAVELTTIKYRFAVQLRADGSYNLHEFTEPTDWSVFLSALTLLRWKQRHNIEVPA